MFAPRLKYIVKDKIDYTNEILNRKQGVVLRKIKFLLDTFSFSQRKLSRLQSKRARSRIVTLQANKQRHLRDIFPIIGRHKANILNYSVSTHELTRYGGVPLSQSLLLREKRRIAKLLEICRNRNLFFKLMYSYRHLFLTIELPTFMELCSIFIGPSLFFPFELYWLLYKCGHTAYAAKLRILKVKLEPVTGMRFFTATSTIQQKSIKSYLKALASPGVTPSITIDKYSSLVGGCSLPILEKKRIKGWSTAWLI